VDLDGNPSQALALAHVGAPTAETTWSSLLYSLISNTTYDDYDRVTVYATALATKTDNPSWIDTTKYVQLFRILEDSNQAVAYPYTWIAVQGLNIYSVTLATYSATGVVTWQNLAGGTISGGANEIYVGSTIAASDMQNGVVYLLDSAPTT
jgi:hypothetical protein